MNITILEIHDFCTLCCTENIIELNPNALIAQCKNCELEWDVTEQYVIDILSTEEYDEPAW